MKTIKKYKYLFFLFLCYFYLNPQPINSVETKPLLIGATVSLEGSYQETSAMLMNAFRLWEKQVNEKGGVLGRPVKLILYDDKSQVELVHKYYKKLITEDKVDLLFSPYSTTLTLAASEITEQYKYILLACGASGESIWQRGYKYIFGVYATAGRYFIGLLDLIAREGYETVSIIYENDSFNLQAALGAGKWAEKFGLQVILLKEISRENESIDNIILRVEKAQADALLVCAYPEISYEFLKKIEKFNYKPTVLGMTITPALPDFYSKAGNYGENIFAPSQWEPNERIPFPGTREFIKNYLSYAQILPSYHAGSAYAACQIMEKAIVTTNSLDQDKLREYILALDTVTVIGRFKVDNQGLQIGHNSIIIQWQKGKKEIVYPLKMQTASPTFIQSK